MAFPLKHMADKEELPSELLEWQLTALGHEIFCSVEASVAFLRWISVAYLSEVIEKN